MNFRLANENDIYLYYFWVNDPKVRENSFNSEKISFQDHVLWFNDKINDPNCKLYLFFDEHENALGQVRIQKDNQSNSIINLSLDDNFRGLGYGVRILDCATFEYFSKEINTIINAYVKVENIGSIKIFEKSGYINLGTIIYQNIKSFHFIKYADR